MFWEAEKVIIQYCQGKAFAQEIAALQKGEGVKRIFGLVKLVQFISCFVS